LEPTDNFTKKAEFTRNADGKITGFTINFGDNWNWAMYIEYTTELTSPLPKGAKVANDIEWSASNFEKPRSVNALTRLEAASGTGSGEQTTTEASTTTSTTTEVPTTTSTTTEGPQKTTENNPKRGNELPKTGENLGTGLVLAGILILAGTLVLKRKYSND